MRIISGELGGRRLLAPKGAATRPTSDRVRESLFSILGPPPSNASVLDLCAGAGTLGFEALSRGARAVVFVESAKSAVTTLRQNITHLGVEPRVEVVVAKLPNALERSFFASRRFDWVFLDPPYKSTLYAPILELLGEGELLAEDPVVIVEHDRRAPPAEEAGCLVRTDRRRYGDTEISFYRRGAE